MEYLPPFTNPLKFLLLPSSSEIVHQLSKKRTVATIRQLRDRHLVISAWFFRLVHSPLLASQYFLRAQHQ